MLIKPDQNKNIEGAQGRKILCFFSIGLMLCGVGLSQPAQAQQQIYNVSPANNAANAEIRLQQMETQLRDLTGKLEQQDYEIGQLKQTIINLQNAQIQGLSQNNNVGASQIAEPTRETVTSPIIAGVKPPEIRGIQTAKPVEQQITQTNSSDPTARYENAFAQIKDGNYGAAQTAFESFLKDHKDHVLAANAKYWLGETFYVRGEYKEAAKTFAEGFQSYSESAKAPDILLKLGLSLAGMEKMSDACVALGQVPVKFPSADSSLLERANSEMERLNCGA